MNVTIESKPKFQELECDHSYVVQNNGVYRARECSRADSRLITVGGLGSRLTLFVGDGRVEAHSPKSWSHRTFYKVNEEITLKFSN